MQKYECRQCQANFRAMDSCGCSCSKDDTKCPQCGSTDIKKIEGADKIRDSLKNFHFTGGG